jgi:hypothetical protein
MIDSDGDFRVISTEARSAINDTDERAKLGQDTEFLKQMYQPNGTYTPGVYYGCISSEAEKVFLITRDSEQKFCYKVNNKFKLEKQIYSKFDKA